MFNFYLISLRTILFIDIGEISLYSAGKLVKVLILFAWDIFDPSIGLINAAWLQFFQRAAEQGAWTAPVRIYIIGYG